MENAIQPIQLLVVQPTAFCNIDCSYCYLPLRRTKGRMADHILSSISENIVNSEYFDSKSLVLWHAGEPLSIPVQWYHKAYQLFSDARTEPTHFQFQTNGMLIDDSWADFLSETKSSVGLSIDGPLIVHDFYRKDRQGYGTLKQTLRGMDFLKKRNIPFTVISTITEHSLANADQIYDFIHDIHPEKWGLSIEEAEGANTTSTVYNESSLMNVERFFFRIAARNFSSKTPLRIREIEQVLSSLAMGQNSGHVFQRHNQENMLGSIVSVGMDGSVSFFSPELLTSIETRKNGGVIGNIVESTLEELLTNAKTKRLQDAILAGVELCRSSCEFYDFCGGGSPANKYAEHGRYDVSDTWQCTLSKKAVARGVLAAIAAPA